jgi:hypothetical protein
MARATASSATLELLDAFRKITQGQRVLNGLTIVHNASQVKRRCRVGSAAKTCTVAKSAIYCTNLMSLALLIGVVGRHVFNPSM